MTTFEPVIKINGSWYRVGDKVKMPSFLIFTKEWLVESIHYDCFAILKRKGKIKLAIGTVHHIIEKKFI